MPASLSGSATVHDQGALGYSNFTITVPSPTGANRALVVKIYSAFDSTSNVSSVSYGGQTLTRVGGISANNNRRAEIWILNSAGIAAATSTDLNVQAPEGRRWGIIAEPWQDVDQTTLFENVATVNGVSAAAAVDVLSSTGDVATCAIMAGGTSAYNNPATAGDTEIAQTPFGNSGSGGSEGRGMSSYAAGGGTINLDWALVDSGGWEAVGVSLKSASPPKTLDLPSALIFTLDMGSGLGAAVEGAATTAARSVRRMLRRRRFR